MSILWSRARRRQQLLLQPFPPQWDGMLRQHVRHFQYLDARQRSRLEGFVQVLVAEKDWAGGGGGFTVTEEMKVTIAGYAGVMTLGLPEPYYFDRLKTIIVYPTAYLPHRSQFDIYPQYVPLAPRSGEAWHRGPVILSWAEIVEPAKRRPGSNLVIHEFAHHVDGLDGDVDGTPPINDREKGRNWYRVTEEEFERLARETARGDVTLLDQYGATNRAEFFAVASECFFERPHAMRDRHPELYQALADFYCQDISGWLPDAPTVGCDSTPSP
ncbi:MAG TPA: M90 family metallopeptidase [Pirellulales bacterium]|nr:M90 family metallopeptidase [Pirellulales bacterium]